MARQANTNGAIYTNSANCQWFFNLADNADLDTNSGGFTVFGRVIKGVDVLAKFNQFSTNSGIVNYYTFSGDTNAEAFTDLPVTSSSLSAVRNSDLFFANISILSGGKTDTTAPKVTITYPANGAKLTNGSISFQGRATDDKAVHSVYMKAMRYAAFSNETDGEYVFPQTYGLLTNVSGRSSVTYAMPAIHDMLPGSYIAWAISVDGWGNTSRIKYMPYDTDASGTIYYLLVGDYLKYTITTPLVVQAETGGTVTPNTTGTQKNIASTVIATAKANSGNMFTTWTATWVDSSKTVTNTYTANPLSIAMRNSMTLVASFATNYYPQVAGKYSGLFYPTNGIDLTNSGMITITPTSVGAYSGKFYLSNQTVSITGKFDQFGSSHLAFTLPKNTNAINLDMTIDLTNGTGLVTGTVSNAFWTANLTAHRDATKLTTNVVAGKYIMKLPGELGVANQPEGDGYQTVTVAKTAAVTSSGKLADGTVIQPAGALSQDGVWPLFVSLYSGKGILMGWQSAITTNLGGSLQWVRASTSAATNVYSMPIQTTGALLTLPATNTTYNAVLEGGSLETTVTATVTINKTRKLVVGAPSAGALTLTYTASTGLITGKYTPTGGQPAGVFAAFASPEAGGFGSFTNKTGISGRFTLQQKATP
jgi:hypothetical protein